MTTIVSDNCYDLGVKGQGRIYLNLSVTRNANSCLIVLPRVFIISTISAIVHVYIVCRLHKPSRHKHMTFKAKVTVKYTLNLSKYIFSFIL